MDREGSNFKALPVLIGTPDISEATKVVIGRFQLVDLVWRKLKSSNITLLSERRIGKTWVLILARAIKPEWAIPLFIDVEGINSAQEFVLRLNEELYRSELIPANWWDKIQNWSRRWYQKIQEKKMASIEIPVLDPWNSLLEDTCRKLIERSNGKFPVLMIDELPLFLDKIIKSKGSEEAIKMLDLLRSLRQVLPSLRMVFCGSLGFHIVLRKLKEKGYTGSPINDLLPIEVPPLALEDAYYLAGCLLRGEDIGCYDLKAAARSIASLSSGVPFYIQNIVNWMGSQTVKKWNPEEVASLLTQLFNSPIGHSVFSYYDERLNVYYPDDIVEKARAALDVLSRREEGLPFDDLLNLVRHRPKTLIIDAEVLLEVIHLLRDDHYIIHKDGRWQFKLEITRLWWFEARGRLAL